MKRKRHPLIAGSAPHHRTEGDYLGVLLNTVSLDDWRTVVLATLDAAKAGDAGSRAWLAQYLVGKPATAAPAPMTVVVQQLAGRDPLVEQLVQPHLDRLRYPGLHTDDDLADALRAQVLEEVRASLPPTMQPTGPSSNAGSVDGEVSQMISAK